MAYLGTYIRQILSGREPVVLPGFGSLVIIESKGGKGMDGKIIPPGQTIHFDPAHPKGDGKLAGVYAAGERIDPEEARQQVLELVDAIKFKLDKGEKFKLEEVGTFSRDDDNRIHFTKDPDWMIDPKTFGLDSLDLLELEDEEAEEPALKGEPTGAGAPAVRGGGAAEEVPAGKTPRSPGRKPGQVTPGGKKPSRSIQRKPVNKWKIIWIVVGALIAVLVLILLIPSGNGVEFGKEGIVIRDMNGKTGGHSSDRPEGERDKRKTGEDEAVNGQPAEEEAAVEAPRDEPPVQQNSYFIIAGSFQNLQNATELMSKLKASGFPAEMIVTENRMYRVSIRSYADREEAIRELPRVKAESGMEGAWVMAR
jgi:cell division protein FtsN/nucleoid DNA-binding protein